MTPHYCMIHIHTHTETPVIDDATPVFLQHLQDVSLTEDQPLTLACRVTSAQRVWWYKHGVLLHSTADVRQTWRCPVARLEIAEAFERDSGQYTCVALNEHSGQEGVSVCFVTVTASASFKSTVEPMFLSKLRDLTLNEGDSLLLECDVVGSPEPSVHWLRDGLDLPDTLSYLIQYDGRTARFIVEKMGVGEEGVFRCLARNEAGSASVDARVTVQKRKSPPVFTTPLQDVTSEPGQNVILKCDVSGTPPPTLCWRRNGLMVGDSLEFVTSLGQGQGCLEILGVKAKHEGKYECVATSEAGRVVCSCRLTVTATINEAEKKPPSPQHPEQTTTPTTPPTNATTAPFPPSVRRRTFKKLSEPHPSDIITAVLQSAAGKRNGAGSPSAGNLQRAQSFSPQTSSSSTPPRAPGPIRAFSAALAPASNPARSLEGGEGGRGGVSESRYSVQWTDSHGRVTEDSGVASFSSLHSSSPSPYSSSSSSSSVSSKAVTLTGTSTTTATSHGPTTSSNSANTTSNSLLQQNRDSASNSRALKSQSFRHSSRAYNPSPERSRPSQEEPPQSRTTPTSSSALSSSNSASSSLSSSSSSSSSTPHGSKVLPAAASASPRSMVSQLRAQFTKLEEGGGGEGGKGGGGGGGIRRWHSMPLRQEKPVVVKTPCGLWRVASSGGVFAASGRNLTAAAATCSLCEKRGTSHLATQDSRPTSSSTASPTTAVTMSSYENIDDEEELHKMMNATESFDERKKIRNRLRELRDKQRADMEARRQQREKETEQLVRKKFEMAEAEKKRKMAAYSAQKPVCERDSEYLSATQKLIKDKHKQADEDKQKKLEAYKHIADKEHKAGEAKPRPTVTKTPGGAGSSVKQTSGFGGVQYGKTKTPELNTRELRDQLSSVSGPGSSGSISVKTESWSSREGVLHKAQKTESWGAKPQGARGAMAAFKQMDSANPSAAKPNGLVTVSLAKKAASTMRRNVVAIKEEILRFVKANVQEYQPMTRSPSAIKTMLLEWCKAMTREYENIAVTNFSSSWNDGLAFCALIHHFYPDSFDYSQLESKNRRHNFELAFNTAEKVADISPLLDVEDMVKMKNPDWKCVFTYVQSYYRHLRDHENNKAKAPAAES
ncbi:hypothetical protein ACOMHN_013399 [Nucella lapillus]